VRLSSLSARNPLLALAATISQGGAGMTTSRQSSLFEFVALFLPVSTIRSAKTSKNSVNLFSHSDFITKLWKSTGSSTYADHAEYSDDTSAKPQTDKPDCHSTYLDDQDDQICLPSPPPSKRQIDILKYFKVKDISLISRNHAHCLIKTLFADPLKVEQWNRRPPTTKVKQGILFMGGRLDSNMTQLEAQSKLMQFGANNPQRFQEWKHVEYLFNSANDSETLKQYASRKFTWFRFFQLYECIARSGIRADDINPEMLHRESKRIGNNQLSCCHFEDRQRDVLAS
jgi:hypothetical protein